MSVTDLILQRSSSPGLRSLRELVARYQQLRAVCRSLNNAMVQRLSKDALHEGGRKLGLLRNGIFVFDNEHEMDVLMDYCLYHVQRNGRNTVEQYYRDNPPAPGTDESACLRAMQIAIHSLIRVDAVEPGVALAVTDLATGEQYLLVDIGLSQSAEPGTLFLSRLLLFDDFVATGGTAIVLGQVAADEAASFAAEWKKVSTSRNADYDPSPLIRDCLQKRLMDHMRYLDPPGSPVRDPQMLHADRRKRTALLQRVGKSADTRRCPCGSGKMFKNCCMRKPR